MIYDSVKLHRSARIAPNATLVGDIVIGANSIVLWGCTLRSERGSKLIIGQRTNIQELCCIHMDWGNDCIIGDEVSVGHGALLHGCTIGDGSTIGMGAILLDGAVIGNDCMVGAGSVVTHGKVFEPGSLIMGTPARFIRTLSEDEIRDYRSHKLTYYEIGNNLLAEGLIYEACKLPKDIATIADFTLFD